MFWESFVKLLRRPGPFATLDLWAIYIGGVVSILLAGLWLGYSHIREGTYIACDHIAYVFILQEFRRKPITVLLFLKFQITRNHWLDMKLIVIELLYKFGPNMILKLCVVFHLYAFFAQALLPSIVHQLG